MWNVEQPSYKRLRLIHAERRRPIAFWIGAGFSAPANLPTWAVLKRNMIQQGLESVAGVSEPGADLKEEILQRTKAESNFWEAFEIIKHTIGDTEFYASIRETFQAADSARAPSLYDEVWRLPGVRSILTLNIDGFANKSHRLIRQSEVPAVFNGRDAPAYTHLLAARRPFIANLHGVLDDHTTWVFTKSDVDQLFASSAYRDFLKMIFGSMTVVFAGISADDLAAGGTLAALTSKGMDLGSHFWITDRPNVHDWSASAGIQVIRYQPVSKGPEAERHSVTLKNMFEDLREFTSRDSKAAIVVPTVEATESLPSSRDLRLLDEDDLRVKLSGFAKNLLSKNRSDTNSPDYLEFLARYAGNIHQAWHISTYEPSDIFYGYKVVRQIHQSPFSTVWEIKRSNGDSLALKLLRIENLNAGPQIESFRRGVQSLQYLTNAGVPFTAHFIGAYEIPTAVIMQFVEGGSLSDVVQAGVFDAWPDFLDVMSNVCRHLIYSHNLPQGVLHRDVRPSNIMLPYAYWTEADALAHEHSRFEVALLNYDMSWHSNAAGQTIAGNLEEAGYYSPEQLAGDADRSRTTLVDSYGIGMSLYYAFSKQAPPAAGSASKDWDSLLTDKIRGDNKIEWRSAPARLRRLISGATKSEVGERLTVTAIDAELKLLFNAISGRRNLLPADLWAEELLTRSEEARYEVSDDGFAFTRSPRTGRSITLRGDSRGKVVSLKFRNQAIESTDRSGIDRIWSEKLDRAKSVLSSRGWEIADSRYAGMEILLTATISVSDLLTKFDRAIDGLKRGLAIVRLE